MIPIFLVGGGVAAAAIAVWAYLYGPRCRFVGQCRVAVIGDSISAGRGYVDVLDADLPRHEFDVFGGVGWGTTALLAELRRALPQHFDEVIIEGGANDLGRPDAESYILGNLEQMVKAARASGARVVLLTLTPWSRDVDTIQAINTALRWRGPLWGAKVVDVWSPLADQAGGLRAELIGDAVMGIHPNSAGHRLIARAILDDAY